MRGGVLAGGTGSRMLPLTKVTNKHRLPVCDKPMISYPFQTMVNVGILDVLLVTGGRNAGEFLRLLGDVRALGLNRLHYTYQEGGVAQALGLAELFAERGPICASLGDNIIEKNICRAVERFRQQERGAKILLKQVPDAHRFGVAEIRRDRAVRIEKTPRCLIPTLR